MARGAEGGIPGNSLGQGFTSSSTLTHLLGVSGAPTGTVGGAAVGSGSIENYRRFDVRRDVARTVHFLTAWQRASL